MIPFQSVVPTEVRQSLSDDLPSTVFKFDQRTGDCGLLSILFTVAVVVKKNLP
jgi:hypothetical protein